MKTKNPAAVALGRIGGSKKTRAKINASRKNGKKGGKRKKAIVPLSEPDGQNFTEEGMNAIYGGDD